MRKKSISKIARRYLGRFSLAGLGLLACAKENPNPINPNNQIYYEELMPLPNDLIEKLSEETRDFKVYKSNPAIPKNVLRAEGLCRFVFFSHETTAHWGQTTDPRTEAYLFLLKSKKALRVLDQDVVDRDESGWDVYTNPDGFPNLIDILEVKDPNVHFHDIWNKDNCMLERRYSARDPYMRWRYYIHDPRDGELQLAGQYFLKFAKQRVRAKTSWKPTGNDTTRIRY